MHLWSFVSCCDYSVAECRIAGSAMENFVDAINGTMYSCFAFEEHKMQTDVSTSILEDILTSTDRNQCLARAPRKQLELQYTHAIYYLESVIMVAD